MSKDKDSSHLQLNTASIEYKCKAVIQYHVMEALTTTSKEDEKEVVESIEEEWNLASDEEVINELERIYS